MILFLRTKKTPLLWAALLSTLFALDFYFFLLHPAFFRKRDLMLAALLWLALLPLLFLLLDRFLLPRLHQYSPRAQRNWFFLTFAICILSSLVIRPSLPFFLLPTRSLQINIPQGSADRTITLEYFNTAVRGDISFSQLTTTGNWYRTINGLTFSGQGPASISWSGITGSSATILFSSSNSLVDIQVGWNNSFSPLNITNASKGSIPFSFFFETSWFTLTAARILVALFSGFLFLIIALLVFGTQRVSIKFDQRTYIAFFLFSFFCLAFVFSPYWVLPQTESGRVFLLLGTLLGGCLWSISSAGEIKIKIKLLDFFWFIILFATILLLNFRSINSVIPWRGDEDHHINWTIGLINLSRPITIVCVFLLFFLILIISKKFLKFGLIIWSFLLIASISIFVFFGSPIYINIQGSWLLRYPFVNYWVFSILPSIASFINLQYTESLFRAIPFISAVGIVFVFTNEIKNRSLPTAWFWGISIATIPLFLYYSSILYLEMPALLLISIVLLRIPKLLFFEDRKLKNDIGWISLILIGFIKETAFIFLFGFLLFRWFFQYARTSKLLSEKLHIPYLEGHHCTENHLRFIKGEFFIAFSVLFPSLLYLILQSTFTIPYHQYLLSLNQIIDISTYSVLLRSYLEQFGFFLPLYFFGIIHLFLVKRVYLGITIVGFSFIFITFFALDDWKYIGYSRFNLLLLPLVIFTTTIFFRSFRNNRIILIAIIISAIITNLIMTPILMDGTKKPFWGNYNFDTSEHYYPYNNVLEYLKKTAPNSPIFITGLDYRYFFDFYFSKFKWKPDYKVINDNSGLIRWEDLNSILLSANNNGYNSVIIQVSGIQKPPNYANIGPYSEKIFCNSAHCLLLFSKK